MMKFSLRRKLVRKELLSAVVFNILFLQDDLNVFMLNKTQYVSEGKYNTE